MLIPPLLPNMPVMTHPMFSVIWKRCVMVDGSRSLSGTFFCVATTAQSIPRMAIDVRPPWLMALNAYSKIKTERSTVTSEYVL